MEMDDLLDQLEEEVEKERRLNHKDQTKENDANSLAGLLIPSTSGNISTNVQNSEEPALKNDCIEDVVNLPGTANQSASQNGQAIEEERIVSKNEVNDQESTSIDNLPTINDPAPLEEVSVDISLSFERPEAVNSPILTTLNEENRLIDEATIPETDGQQNGHIDVQQTGQNGNDPLENDLNSESPNTSADTQTEMTSEVEADTVEPSVDIQEVIEAITQEDGLDYETIANQKQELSNHSDVNPTNKLIECVLVDEQISTTNGMKPFKEMTEVEESIELTQSTELSSSANFTHHCKQEEAVNLSVEASQQKHEKSDDQSQNLEVDEPESKEVVEKASIPSESTNVDQSEPIEESSVLSEVVEESSVPPEVVEEASVPPDTITVVESDIIGEPSAPSDTITVIQSNIVDESGAQQTTETLIVKSEIQEVTDSESKDQFEEQPISSNNQSPETPEVKEELTESAFEMAKNLLEEIGDVKQIVALAKERKKAKEMEQKIENEAKKEVAVEELDYQPGQSIEQNSTIEDPSQTESPVKEQRKSVILSTHAVGNNVGNDLRLTESELQLGKSKPVWIKDEDCKKCMLCTAKFTLVNRRHHCRCCGRVLCSECCSIRRTLPYMQPDEKKQRVCSPCNSTLDRIELYEKAAESSAAIIDQPSSSSTTEPPITQASSMFVRKKSVLKNRTKSENETTQTEPAQSTQSASSDLRRSVKFLDGVSPGDELSPTSQQAEQDRRQSGIFSSRSNRSSRSSSRRTREMLANEENLRLNAPYFYSCTDWTIDSTMKPWKASELFKRLNDKLHVRLILKRNIYVVMQLVEYQKKKVYALYTVGFNTLGVDELLIAFEKNPTEQEEYLPGNLIRSLMRYSEICLSPTTNSLDDRNGIRQCANRMSPLFEIDPDESEGHNAVAIYFHPYQGQDLHGITHPTRSTFRIGIFVQEPELPLVRAMPSRFLYRLGMSLSVYPVPVLNEIGRSPVFEPFKSTSEMASSTILTMFHDFRNNSYQLSRIPGSYALMRERETQICLPTWSQEQMKRMAEANSNLLAWALDLSYQADSVFSCERIGNTFSTRIFMRSNTRDVIGAAFIAFSTGHKGSENGFTLAVVEDGLVIRLNSDGLESLLKKLASGDDFRLETESGNLEVKWLETEELTSYGAISSPIDDTDLRGFYQYGLLLNRVLHANQVFYSDKTKALRLGSVISLNHHRIDPQLQSHFFDACEQLTLWLKTSLENYVQILLGLDITQISVRIYANIDRVGYEMDSWLGLEEAYDEFLKTLAEKIIPFLYHLLETTQMDFKVELHLPIISIQPLTQDAENPTQSVPYSSGLAASNSSSS